VLAHKKSGDSTLARIFADAKPFFNDIKAYSIFEKKAGPRFIDALFYFPRVVYERMFVTGVKYIPLHTTKAYTLFGEVISHSTPLSPQSPYCISLKDDHGNSFYIAYFYGRTPHYYQSFPQRFFIGRRLFVSGKVSHYNGIFSFQHPDKIGNMDEVGEWVGKDTLYPLSRGLYDSTVRDIIHKSLEACEPILQSLPEWIPCEFMEKVQWPRFFESLKRVHKHTPYNTTYNKEDEKHFRKAFDRLLFDETLAHQLSLLISAQHRQKKEGISIPIDQKFHRSFLKKNVPFSLTSGQIQALEDVFQDMQGPKQMVRLIQGDVGSGKTIVAILCALQAMKAGYQFAFLAPTDILARQQLASLDTFLKDTPFKGALLTSKEKGKARTHLLKQLKEGSLHYLVGTHALFEESVIFQKLGLVVVDEQHRFGVDQRLRLIDKGEGANVLSLSATPIPRTLLMASYGDMDVSVISDKPQGRKDIITTLVSLKSLKKVATSLKKSLLRGEKIYWVCPLVEESEKIDLMNVKDRFDFLNTLYPGRVGLLHGKLKGDEKQRVIESFSTGSIAILVATTVIEVGVDIKEATLMVIEHAERFGLAQLHQLRGRVGRNNKQSNCVLLYSDSLSPISRKRLEAMRAYSDGFSLAEIDLKLRGGGDLVGTKQSGFLDFRLLREDDERDMEEVLTFANKYARFLLSTSLSKEQRTAIALLLRLFDREDALKYFTAG
jgi:ATP-dependent DNA helicase RecG